MDSIRLRLEPTSVPEWDAEDALAGVLGGEQPAQAGQAQLQEELDKAVIELPRSLNPRPLTRHEPREESPLAATAGPDTVRHDFYLIEIPLTIITPGEQRLERLRLTLHLEAEGQRPEDVVAYDLFPRTQADVKTLMSGEASLDVSEALQLALKLSGPAGAAASPALKCLGLKLSLPFKWTSTKITLQSSGPMSNPVQWYVTDQAMQNGFSATAIVRAPKRSSVSAAATLVGELWSKSAWGLLKVPFRHQQAMRYAIA